MVGLTIVTKRVKDYHDVDLWWDTNAAIIAGSVDPNKIGYSVATGLDFVINCVVVKCSSFAENDENCCIAIREHFAVKNV